MAARLHYLQRFESKLERLFEPGQRHDEECGGGTHVTVAWSITIQRRAQAGRLDATRLKNANDARNIACLTSMSCGSAVAGSCVESKWAVRDAFATMHAAWSLHHALAEQRIPYHALVGRQWLIQSYLTEMIKLRKRSSRRVPHAQSRAVFMLLHCEGGSASA